MIKHTTNSEIIDQKMQLCTFWIADLLYGVNLLDVKEINTETTFTYIHQASDKIKGYVNIRGQIYLVLDLRKMLGYNQGEVNNQSRILLFKDSVGPTFGVLVDKIGDVVEVEESEIEVTPDDTSKNSDETNYEDSFLYGTCKLDQMLLTALNANKFLECI